MKISSTWEASLVLVRTNHSRPASSSTRPVRMLRALQGRPTCSTTAGVFTLSTLFSVCPSAWMVMAKTEVVMPISVSRRVQGRSLSTLFLFLPYEEWASVFEGWAGVACSKRLFRALPFAQQGAAEGGSAFQEGGVV